MLRSNQEGGFRPHRSRPHPIQLYSVAWREPRNPSRQGVSLASATQDMPQLLSLNITGLPQRRTALTPRWHVCARISQALLFALPRPDLLSRQAGTGARCTCGASCAAATSEPRGHSGTHATLASSSSGSEMPHGGGLWRAEGRIRRTLVVVRAGGGLRGLGSGL